MLCHFDIAPIVPVLCFLLFEISFIDRINEFWIGSKWLHIFEGIVANAGWPAGSC